MTEQPDRIVVNGRILTFDGRFSTAEAIAVAGGRIVVVGSTAEIRALAGSTTVIDDLDGAIVLPGLIDPHNHLLSTSQLLGQIQLYDCRSLDELLDRVSERARSLTPGSWIQGRGWDESLLAERRPPTRWELDAAAPDHPVVLHRVWNKLVANSAALGAAGITRETPDPAGGDRYAGSFDRDPETGEPTGLFRDRAKDLITAAVPPPTRQELIEALRAGCQAYNGVGLVAVSEPGLSDDGLAALAGAREAGALSVRTDALLAGWGFVPAAREPELKEWILDVAARPRLDDDLLRIGGVKFMLDGGVGDRTARMDEPFEGEPDNLGQWVVDPEEYPRLVRWVHDHGFSIDTHTCGTAAQDLAVRSYAAALDATPRQNAHHRIHHGYFPSTDALALMARYKIPALVSNPFLVHLAESFVASVGERRAARAMPMASYLRAGVPLAGSSDSPVSDFNPFVGMYAAVARTTITGRQLDQSECISREDALRSYTSWAAAATGDGRRRGSIELGKLADLIVVDRDPLAASPEELRDTRVLRTMVGGAWV